MKLVKQSIGFALVVFTAIGVMGCNPVKPHDHHDEASHQSEHHHHHSHNHGVQRGSGVISGFAFDEYTLKLKSGDVITSQINSDKLDVIIYAPESATLQNGEPYTVAQSGEYILRVLLPRAFARREGKYPYEFTVTTAHP